MIKNIHIKNYALIDEVNIDFSDNLNIITGETGAGKSILLGALGLIMGKRADTKVLFDQDQKCVVEAIFDVKAYQLKGFFEENDIDYSDELLIRREIVTSGKSRAFINDSPVTLDTLTQLTDELVDLHQQFDSLELNTEKFQREVLDALAANHPLLEQYKSIYIQYKSTTKELDLLQKQKAERAKELEFNVFLLTEINEVKLQEDEYEDLVKELDLLTSTEDIKAVSAKISAILDQNEHSVVPLIAELSREVRNISNKDPRFGVMVEKLDSIKAELRDLTREADDIFETTEYDEKRIVFVQDRIAVIHKLLKKHGLSSTEELLQLQDELAEKVKDLDTTEERILKLEKRIMGLTLELDKAAMEIREKRIGQSSNLRMDIINVLSELGMPNANFEVSITETDQFLPHGKDQIRFLFSANKGGKLMTIKEAASGGEMSRLILVIKSLVAGAMALPTMIFDEVDSGVSGEIAHKMGMILQKLAQKHQIISITHSPQIAAKASQHYFVYKSEGQDKTYTAIKILNQEERVEEIAKMLSGNPPSRAAVENAKELMGS
jgi:DNA repair protein RecN (Recombination protein N)